MITPYMRVLARKALEGKQVYQENANELEGLLGGYVEGMDDTFDDFFSGVDDPAALDDAAIDRLLTLLLP